VKFKAAVERQKVDLMVMHNDSHESLKEGIQKLAIQTRKEFRNISCYASPLTSTSVPNTSETETSAPAYLLKMANKDLEKRQADWNEQRSEYVKRVKQLEEEKKKLLDQISHVGVKNYQRKLERTKELSESRKLAEDAVKISEEHAVLRKKAEHSDGVQRKTEIIL
jgi:hypothetical protein